MQSSKRNPVKELETLIREIAEKNDLDPQKTLHVFKLISEPSSGDGYSDEDLEALTGYKQAEIRRILRVLYEARIAQYKKGIHPSHGIPRYFWKVDSNMINYVLLRRKKSVLLKLKERLEFESSNEFYRCPRDGSRYTFNEAYSNDFRCTRCGSLLEYDDNSKVINSLREAIEKLEREIEEDERRVYGS